MGCDIHIWVEVQDENGKWHTVPYPSDLCHDEWDDNVPDHLRGRVNTAAVAEYTHGRKELPIPIPFDVNEFLGPRKPEDNNGREDHTKEGAYNIGKWWHSAHPMSFLDGRNYNLFSILADVRNGYGFAGCKTGEGFVPISKPRGMPSDSTQDFKDHVESWGVDGHSHSYHTLKQLLDYDWDQTTNLQGVVGMLEYARWVKSKRGEKGYGPASYSGGVSGPSIRMVPEEEMLDFVIKRGLLDLVSENEDSGFGFADDERLKKLDIKTPDGQSWYTTVRWGEKYSTSAGGFYDKVIPWMQSLVTDPEKIRIVFFFDN